jgi:hypothetical protein
MAKAALDADCERFVRENDRSYMFVLDGEGAVRGWPMTARYGNGIFVMTTYRKSPKMKFLGPAKRMTLVVTSKSDAEVDRYVLVEGELRITPVDAANADAVLARMFAAGRRDETGSGHFAARLREGKRVLIEVLAESMSLHRLGGEPA